MCSGSESSFTAGVRADFGVIKGGIDGFEKRYATKCQVRGKGLTATDAARTMWATTAEEIRDGYDEVKGFEPVPILVEYRRVPNAPLGDYAEYDWKLSATVERDKVEVAAMAVDSRNDEWQDTGIVLSPGDMLSIDPRGEITIGSGKRAVPWSRKIVCRGALCIRDDYAPGALELKAGSEAHIFVGVSMAIIATNDLQGAVKLRVYDTNWGARQE